MSVGEAVTSDHQLTRLLQIGVVLEELVEARAYHHYRTLADEGEESLEGDVAELLEHAREESAEHRARLEALIDALDGEGIDYREIEELVQETYGRTRPEDFDGVLYDQLAGEETAYKFYDDLIAAIEDSDATFGIDREELLAELRAIREEEADGVEEVTEIMRRR